MGTIVADVVARFRNEGLDDLTDGVNNANDALQQMGDSGGGELSAGFKKAGEDAKSMSGEIDAASQVLDTMDSAVTKVGNNLKNLAVGSLGIGGIGLLLHQASETTQELQTLGVQMNATFGPSGMGMLKQATEYANQFGISVQAAGSAFVMFGQATKGSNLDISKNMREIADIAAGTGSSVDALAASIGNYYQIIQRSGGQGGAASRYAQQLVTSHVITQEEANKLRIMSNQGADPAALVNSILASGEQTYAGAGTAQANTLGNQIQTFKNQFKDAFAGGEGALSPLFKDLTEGLKNLNQWMQGDQFKGLVNDIGAMVNGFAGALTMLRPFGEMFLTVGSSVAGLASQLGKIGSVMEVVVAGFLALKAVKFADEWLGISRAMERAESATVRDTVANNVNTESAKTNAAATSVQATAKTTEAVAAETAVASETARQQAAYKAFWYGTSSSPTDTTPYPGKVWLNGKEVAPITPAAESPGRLSNLWSKGASEGSMMSGLGARAPGLLGAGALVGGMAISNSSNSSTAGYLGSALSGAGAGMMIGGMTGSVPGAVVGAGLGAALGLLTENFNQAAKAVSDYTEKSKTAAQKQIEEIRSGVSPGADAYQKIDQTYKAAQQNLNEVRASMPHREWNQEEHQTFLQAQMVKKEAGSQEAAANNNIRMIETLNPAFGAYGSEDAKKRSTKFAEDNGIDLTKAFRDNASAVMNLTAKFITLGDGVQLTAEQLTNKLGFQAGQIAGQQGQSYVNLGRERAVDANNNPVPTDTGSVGSISWKDFSQLAQKTGINLAEYGVTEQKYNSDQLTVGEAQLRNEMIQASQQLTDAFLSAVMATNALTQATITQKTATASVGTALTSGYTPQFANYQTSLVGNTSLTPEQRAAAQAVIDQYTSLETTLNQVDSVTQNYTRTVQYGGEKFTAQISAGESLATQFTKLSDRVGLVQAQMSSYQNVLGQTLEGTKAYNQEVQNEKLASASTSKQMAELQLAGFSTSSPQYRDLQYQASLTQAQSTITQSNNTMGLGNQQFKISQAQIGQEIGFQVMQDAAQHMGSLKNQLYQATTQLDQLNPAYTAQNNALKEAAPKAQAVAGAVAAQTQADTQLMSATVQATDALNGLKEAENNAAANFSKMVNEAMQTMVESANTFGVYGQNVAKTNAMLAQSYDMLNKSEIASAKAKSETGYAQAKDQQTADALQFVANQIATTGASANKKQIDEWVKQWDAAHVLPAESSFSKPAQDSQYQPLLPGIPQPGAHAAGGPISANAMSWVGEKGPELFVPSVAGTIIPHGSGGGGVNVAQGAVMVQVDVHGGLDHITSADLQNEIANTVNDAFDQLVTTWNGR